MLQNCRIYRVNFRIINTHDRFQSPDMMGMIVSDEYSIDGKFIFFNQIEDLRIHAPGINDNCPRIRSKYITITEARRAIMVKEFQICSISKIASAVFDDLKETFSLIVLTKFVLFRLQSIKSEVTMFESIKRLL